MKKVMPKGHLVEKYRKFHDAEDLWSIAMATQIQEQREKTAILDSFEEGVEQGREEGRKQGIEEGQKEGIRLLLNRQMESKYHEDCSTSVSYTHLLRHSPNTNFSRPSMT